jgi:chemotaxis signal transduction protein
MSLRGRPNSASFSVATASFLIVRLGGTYVALPAEGVRGVLTQEEVGQEQAVTSAGATYQPVDLARRLSVTADFSSHEFRTVLYSTGRCHSAVGVEQVIGLTDVERKECLPLPLQFQCDERNWFQGILLYQDQLVLILNPLGVLEESADIMPVSVGHAEQMVASIPPAIGGPC